MEVVSNSVLDTRNQIWFKQNNTNLHEFCELAQSPFGNDLSTGAAEVSLALKNRDFRLPELSPWLIHAELNFRSAVKIVWSVCSLLEFFIVFSFIPRDYAVNVFSPQDSALGCTYKKLQIVNLLVNSEKTVIRTLQITNSFSYYSSCYI